VTGSTAPVAVPTAAITGSTARAIACSIEAGIVRGALSPGSTLPTVRALASALGTSPATVSSAYRTLGIRGLVIAAGRRGTRIAPRPAIRAQSTEPRADGAPGATGSQRDLTIGLADPQLLPALGPALAHVAGVAPAAAELLVGADPSLRQFALDWFAADGVQTSSVAVTAGALDGLERVLAAHLRVGDRVLIEDPAYPPIRDLLAALGLLAIPVPVDRHGLVPRALAQALARGASALVHVPRGQNPTGAALDSERANALRSLLEADPDLLVIEDDHVSLVAGTPFHSAIAPARRRWAIIRALSKLLHPDLRIALVAGDVTTIARLEGRQALGPRWVSHLLQRTAALLLSDRSFADRCALAARTYDQRRRALIGALRERGIESYGDSGLNVWVPVSEEATVVGGLREAGFAVLAGERFRAASPPGIRISISTLRDGEAELIAATVSDALSRPHERY